MKKYYITIITRATNSCELIERSDKDIAETIDSLLGGWGNLYYSLTSGSNQDDDEYFTAGTTKDNAKAFSILCVKA